MGLAGQSIQSCIDMKEKFRAKYQDYYKSRNTQDEVFKMSQKRMEHKNIFLNGSILIYNDLRSY